MEVPKKTYTVEEYSTLETKYDSLKAQYETLRKQFDEVTKTLENLGDIEDIKAKKDEYKAQAEKIKADFDAFVYKSKVEKFVDTLNPVDNVYKDYITKQLIAENLQLNDSPSQPSTTEKDYLLKIKVLDNALNIRDSASINAKINGVIKDNGTYRIVEEYYNSNDGVTWGKLYSGAGWISLGSKYVQKI